MSPQTAWEWISPGERAKAELEAELDQLRTEVYEVAAGWEIYKVSNRVGNVRNNDSDLLVPLAS